MIKRFVPIKTHPILAVKWDGNIGTLEDIEAITGKRTIKMKQGDFNTEEEFSFADKINYLVEYDGKKMLYVTTDYGWFRCNVGDYVASIYNNEKNDMLSSVIRGYVFEKTYKPYNNE